MKTKVETIADNLMESINNGTYTSKLPSEKELSSLFKTTPVTAGKALNILRDKGIVDRIPGRGTFIITEEVNKTTTLNLLLRSNSEPFYIKLWENIIASLNDKYPAITINIEVAKENYTDAIKVGNYDLFINFSFMSQDLYSYFAPFTDGFKELLGSNNYYFKNLEFVHRANGLAYGLPYTFSPMVLFVNKTLFKDTFKCEVPTSITVDKLVSFATKFTANDNSNNIKFMEFLGIANMFNWISGALLKDKQRSIYDLSVDEFKECIYEIRKLYPKKLSADCSFFDNNVIFRYSNRQFAFKMGGSGGNVDFDVVKLECQNNLGSGFANESIFIHKNCANLKVAQEICKEIIGENIQTFIGQQYLGIPVNKIAALESIDNSNYKDYLIYDSVKNISAHDQVYSNECLETFMTLLYDYVYNEVNYDDFEKQMIKVFEYQKFASQSLGDGLGYEDIFS